MATISSNTDYAGALAEFLDTASWVEDNSLPLAKRHVTAIKALIVLMPNSTTKGANSVGFSKGELQEQLKQAQEFIKARGMGGAVKKADFRRFKTDRSA